MLLAMATGMVLLAPVASALWPTPPAQAHLEAFSMVGTMTAGMVVCTLLRRQPLIEAAVMIAAMWAPYLVLTVPYLLGVLEGDMLVTGGHVLMLLCMFLALRDLAPRVRSRMASRGEEPS
jgi:flagellar biosynthetic protein FliP